MSSDTSITNSTTRIEHWEDNYKKVLEFAQENGHLKFPRKQADTRRLSNWLGRQKRRKDMSNPEREKLAVLKQYGYADDYSRKAEEEEKWNEFFEQFVEYKRVQGRSLISKHDAFHRKLSQWAARQRKMEKEGNLLASRKQRLLEAGFVFRRNQPYNKKKRYTDEQEKRWNEMHSKLCAFKGQHGHCLVTYSSPEYQALSNWVSAQRVVFGKGSMDEVRKKKLDDIGFAWNVKKSCNESD